MAKRRGHGEGSIYQRASDGRWVGVLNLGWEGGKRRRKYVYGASFEDVRAQLTKLERERDQGIRVVTERMTVDQFLTRWLADVVEGRVSPRTHDAYARICRKHITPVIGKRQLGKLTAIDVNALLRDRERAGLSPKMVRQVLIILRMALKQAVLWDLVPRNVASLVTAPAGRAFEAVALDDDQIAAFLSAIKGHRLEALFAIAVILGPRSGELRGLRWRDVELEAGRIHIRMQLVRFGREVSLAEPKTAKSKRTLELPGICHDALRAHRTKQVEKRLSAGQRWHDNDLVFCSSIGTPLDDRQLLREYREVLTKAGLPQIRFHDLRHTAITSMVQKGIPPHVVSQIAGHTTLTMTLGIYAKVVGSTMRDAANVLDAAFSAGETADKVSS